MPGMRLFQMRVRQVDGKAIFLDRDGVINADSGYTHKIEDWRFLPGVLAALAAFKKAGWLLVVVSNQSGIGRGYYTRAQLEKLETWVNVRLRENHAEVDAWYYCPHRPEENCACRKPKPGLILQAAADLAINLSDSWMLGDKIGDVEAGLAAGCHTGLIADRQAGMPEHVAAWPSLAAAARAILAENCMSLPGLREKTAAGNSRR